MGEHMAQDRDGVTVLTMNTIHQSGPVFFASLPCGPRDKVPTKGPGTDGEEAKLRLVSTLWGHLAASENPLWKRSKSSNRDDYPIQVVRGTLGRPELLLGESRGPAISFSKGGGRVWAALCGDDSDIGIDVAESDEFGRDYPVQRVFHPEEFEHALSLADGDPENASALLWSIKEAVVKALGCAFHLVDPRHISVYPAAVENGKYTFPVGLSGKALNRFPLVDGRPLRVRSLPQGKLWLSFALVNRRPAGHE
jgi:phosphopantetheinyl transferase (holo-ACP synthase)